MRVVAGDPLAFKVTTPEDLARAERLVASWAARRGLMADFGREDLSGSTFDWTDLSRSTFRAASLSDVTIRGTDLHRVKMTGVELYDVDISGDINGLRINGVDVTRFVADEVDRREPERALMRPEDPAGFVAAWEPARGAVGRDGRSSAAAGCGPAARAGGRGVVLHRNASSPELRNRRLDSAGH